MRAAVGVPRRDRPARGRGRLERTGEHRHHADEHGERPHEQRRSCRAHPGRRDEDQGDDPRAVLAVFIGYSEDDDEIYVWS